MLLYSLIIIPFFSGVFSLFSYKLDKNIPRWIALIGASLTLFIIIEMFFQKGHYICQDSYSHWDYQCLIPWIPRFGINLNFAVDGLSFLMIMLASFLSIISILTSWYEIKKKEGFFYFNIMMLLSGIIGIFISFDLFLFFCFWEFILIPMYFLVVLWSDQKKKEQVLFAANKFFIYGQISGLILLFSILLLVFNCYHNNHYFTFDYDILRVQPINQYIQYIVILGLFVSFSIKMPIFPFHGWLSDLHVCAPYCGSVEIIGILLKTAPYALLRYNLSFFPFQEKYFILSVMCLGVISIFYGSWMVFSQDNIKRVIAYSSIAHMGFILIAIYSKNEIALYGAIIQILSNSLTTSALCILFGQLYKRCKSQKMSEMGGLWSLFYWIPGFTLFFLLANLGIPGTGNFIGEFLILSGVFHFFPFISVFSIIGILFSSIYSLNIVQKIFYGPVRKNVSIFFVDKQEVLIILLIIFFLIFIGLYPQIIIDISSNFIHDILQKNK